MVNSVMEDVYKHSKARGGKEVVGPTRREEVVAWMRLESLPTVSLAFTIATRQSEAETSGPYCGAHMPVTFHTSRPWSCVRSNNALVIAHVGSYTSDEHIHRERNYTLLNLAISEVNLYSHFPGKPADYIDCSVNVSLLQHNSESLSPSPSHLSLSLWCKVQESIFITERCAWTPDSRRRVYGSVRFQRCSKRKFLSGLVSACRFRAVDSQQVLTCQVLKAPGCRTCQILLQIQLKEDEVRDKHLERYNMLCRTV
ncbi:hypothetical protein J6590_053878 [Homalodisca vitripennis]|nr:hypothetical protein J6590_053878 [Homalodisca vitripennis]